VSEPDVIADDRGRGRGFTTVVVLMVLALVAALAVNSLRHKGSSGAAAPPSSSAPHSVTPTPTPTADVTGPDVVLRVGDTIYEVVDNRLVQRDQLPAGATDVWATTLATDPTKTSDSRVIHVFGLHDGVAFQQDVGPTSSSLAELGPADRVLQTQEYPVLVQDGRPVKVGSSVADPAYGGGGVELPLGWSPGRFENLGYAGLIVKPSDQAGNVEIASWSPGGTPQPLTTAGRLLGVTDGGQAIWLDPSCPDGPGCVLFVGDIGGRHPRAGLPAPVGTEYTTDPAVLGPGGYVAAVATTGATSVLILIEPWQGTATIIPGSGGVTASAGMFWVGGKHLVFVRGGTQLMLYDVDAHTLQPFGPTLPDGARLLTAFGSTGGVTVLP
jgi:hypothetical protein